MRLASFFCLFVPKFNEKPQPITELTKKEVSLKWGKTQQQAFQQIKNILLSEPVLKLFDATRPTELHKDASSLGLAKMLLQRHETNNLYLVYCFSEKTNEVESKYCSSKLDLMAIVWSLNRMRSFLIGIYVTVVTDYQALVCMNGMKTTNPQITRWFGFLQEFDLKVKH